jgi:hypothetical protein
MTELVGTYLKKTCVFFYVFCAMNGEVYRSEFCCRIPLNKEIKQQMSLDQKLWMRRPLTADMVKYALIGVNYLLQLMDAMTPNAGT